MTKRWLGLAFLVACNSPGVGAGADPQNGTGTPDQPIPASTGPYHVTTHVDLSIELILPAQAELVVTTLRAFSTNPGMALIELPGNAGVPAIGTLLSLVPGPLKGKLEDFINGYLDPIEIGGVKLTDAAGTVASLAETALTKVDVDSDLAIDQQVATQQLTAIDLTPAGIDARIPLDLPTDLVSATTTASYGSGTALALGDEHFGFEYGEYAWRAVNQATTSLFGGDLRTMLGSAINCDELGQHVADECVLGLCLGHADAVTSACEAGLDFLVDQVHDKFDSIDIDAVHFASGTAMLLDDDGDGIADRITGGSWDSELNAGLGLRHVRSTFEAAR